LDESRKNGTRGGVIGEAAFRMPLHSQHKVIGRGALHSFDDAITLTTGAYPQAISHHLRRLVMAGVHSQFERPWLRDSVHIIRLLHDLPQF